MELFTRSLTALQTAVIELADEDFGRPSGCSGWLVRDLVCHLIVGAQDVLITLVTPAATEPTHNATTYWDVETEPPAGDGDFDALTVRLAAAYRDPWLLRHHFDDLGSAAVRAAALADPNLRVKTGDKVLTAADYLDAYVLEWTLHHLDLTVHIEDAADPPMAGLARSREILQNIAGTAFPTSISDKDALVIGTGRRAPTPAEVTALGELAGRIPFSVG